MKRKIRKSATIKERIQALLREIVIIRDGGCIFREYSIAGNCGGYRNDGELVLQYDHLNSRTYAISYSDFRLGVCVCKRHHIFWKKQNSSLYDKLVRKHIGKERSDLLDRTIMDKRAYHINWQFEEAYLKQELRKLTSSSTMV